MSYYFNPIEEILEKDPWKLQSQTFGHTAELTSLLSDTLEFVFTPGSSGTLTRFKYGGLDLNSSHSSGTVFTGGRPVAIKEGATFSLKNSYTIIFTGHSSDWTFAHAASLLSLTGTNTQGATPTFFLDAYLLMSTGSNISITSSGRYESDGRVNFRSGSGETSTGTSIAFAYNTAVNYNTAGDLLLRYLNAGVEKASLTYDGKWQQISEINTTVPVPVVTQYNFVNSLMLMGA